MEEYGFGQPHGGIIQTAFIVPNVREAIALWIRDLKAGPFFLIENWGGENPVYRGQPSQAKMSIALGFAGHMQIELIQPLDEHPSVYKEVRDRRGWGFHHFGMASHDIDADIKRLQGEGYVLAFRCAVPTGGEVAYMDGGPFSAGMIEFIEAGKGLDEGFTAMWQASVDWDGTDPIRGFG
jgi:hypothetical protein